MSQRELGKRNHKLTCSLLRNRSLISYVGLVYEKHLSLLTVHFSMEDDWLQTAIDDPIARSNAVQEYDEYTIESNTRTERATARSGRR